MPSDQVRVIDQFSGYILTSGIEQHSCLILEGRKGCGKSTLMEIWMDMLGRKAIPLQLTSLQNGGERFIGQTLAHKNLCWFDEANPRTTSINEFFQNLITGEKIRIERKGVQGDDYVKNTMKVVLSLNEMPDHMPTGMDRRYRHIVFNRSFYEEGIVDPNYKKKILESEKSGVLNRMIAGLDDLTKMGRITMISGEEDRKREYALTSDDFSSFLSDHFEPVNDGASIVRYSYEEMRNSFVAEYPKSYNKQLSVRGFNKKLLTTRLPEFKNISTGKSDSVRGYKGIKLKDGHEFSSNEFEPIRTTVKEW
jgi:phage/plasmid-associated DNA primase